MKKIGKAVLLLLSCASTVASAANVSLSVSGQIQPGVYGRVDIGNAPPPLVFAQPTVIVQQPRPMQPIYMHVPPGHAKKWDKHCHQYNACNRPVYFVKSAEYGHEGEDHGKKDKHHKHKNKHHE